jgi:hypothetical protein
MGHTPAVNHIPVCVRIRGALERSLEEETELAHNRHVLRSSFVMEKNEPRTLRALLTCAPLTAVERTSLPEKEREQPRGHCQKNLSHAFDLQAGPLSRATLYRVGTQDHLYVLTVHNFICDRESALVLSKEVAANYASMVAVRPLPSPTAQYRHSLQSQEGYLRGSAHATEAAYWKNRLRKRSREYCAQNCIFGPFSGEIRIQNCARICTQIQV